MRKNHEMNSGSATRQGQRSNFHKASVVQLLTVLCLFLVSSAHAAPWILERADTPDPVSEEQITELENKARAGDWELKMEFAAAYLYRGYGHKVRGCERLKYGHRCRSMANREKAGSVFLREIIDSIPRNKDERIVIGSFQKDYAANRLFAANPTFGPDSDACREAVHYYELAVENGRFCTALILEEMAGRGDCMPKNQERARDYRNKIPPLTVCPRD
jgi:hypothetical protein